jgi:hypothetical protein
MNMHTPFCPPRLPDKETGTGAEGRSQVLMGEVRWKIIAALAVWRQILELRIS